VVCSAMGAPQDRRRADYPNARRHRQVELRRGGAAVSPAMRHAEAALLTFMARFRPPDEALVSSSGRAWNKWVPSRNRGAAYFPNRIGVRIAKSSCRASRGLALCMDGCRGRAVGGLNVIGCPAKRVQTERSRLVCSEFTASRHPVGALLC